MLRAAGRIFLGLGEDPGDEAGAPSEEEREKADRPLWLMLAPCCAMLALDAALPPDWIHGMAPGAVAAFSQHTLHGTLSEGPSWPAWASVAGALVLAAFALFRHRLPGVIVRPIHATQSAPTRALEALHSGLIGDYVAWLAVGLALMAGVLSFV